MFRITTKEFEAYPFELIHETFPDGTLNLKVNENDKWYDKYYFEKEDQPNFKWGEFNSFMIEWMYESDAELFELYCHVHNLRDRYQNVKIMLVMPYIPNARMDRWEDDGEVFTLKHFATFINSLNLDLVKVYDAHSPVALALINDSVNEWVDAIKFLPRFDSKNTVVFLPDEGARKRYDDTIRYAREQNYGHYLNGMTFTDCPIAYGIKEHDWKTGEITGVQMYGADVNGKDVLIIDDICSKGEEFLLSAQKLKEAGARDIYLYVTHCENTIFEGELLKSDLIKKIYTTDSILTKEHEKINIIYRFRDEYEC